MFLVFLLISVIIRLDYIAILILAWLLGGGDLHIVMAQAGLLGILFSQIRFQLKWFNQTEGEIKKIILCT